ncbi:AlpA family transcriptional regulator [Halieaceae bacterium IMCC14734]|uniref:AlpA family transcriptional regulator n=1 Tax=Candidatus Litorirhabdus singularis TaxID=2518993 RepID=A0ABT3TBV0_9GAMM|nr:AlpA family transcriptional regulator [Candidatus Litorirhabdus singularis]
MDNAVLRWPEVAKIVPISRSHAHALAAQGKFPKPIKLGPRASGWLESEINEWLAQRIADSRPDSQKVVGAV